MTGNLDGRVEVRCEDDWTTDLGGVDRGNLRAIVGHEHGDQARGMRMLELDPGGATATWRDDVEAAWYVIAGSGTVVEGDGERRLALREGHAIHVAPATAHRFEAASDGARLLGGPCPSLPPNDADEAAVDTQNGLGVRLFHRDEPGIRVPLISRDARLLVWIGVEARTANMNYVVLEPGERNTEHVHRYSEDTIHILSGHGIAEDVTNDVELPVGPGDTVQIPPGVWHAVRADPDEVLVSVGGPCPADLDLLEAAGNDISQWTTDEWPPS